MRGLKVAALTLLLRAIAAGKHIYPYEDVPDVQPDVWIEQDRHLTRSDSVHERLLRRSQGTAHVFEHAATQTRLNYVNNSGVCETTPNVRQHSGYMTVGTNMNMWFWQFDARKNASNAPLVAWFNGGPGCSSMIGLFQEHGPCQFYNGSKTPSLNKYSWNEVANMIYIDQPIGTGFSYGSSNSTSTVTSSPYVWKLLQSFYAAFPEYKSRDFAIFTESYGGRYGPDISRYILEQNAKIEAGTLKAEKINLVALGINNGMMNPAHNYQGEIDFGEKNPYKKFLTPEKADSYRQILKTQCLPLLQQCWKTETNSDCTRAGTTCKLRIENPIARGSRLNIYDVRAPASMKDLDPPPTYVKWLQDPSMQSRIGAQRKYDECANAPMRKFISTGDDARNFQPALEKVVQAGVNVLIWAGDTDWICNHMSNLLTADAVKYPGHAKFAAAKLAPYTVKGKKKGEFKGEGNFWYLKVLNAGHEAAYYQPEVSLQAFTQILAGKPLVST